MHAKEAQYPMQVLANHCKQQRNTTQNNTIQLTATAIFIGSQMNTALIQLTTTAATTYWYDSSMSKETISPVSLPASSTSKKMKRQHHQPRGNHCEDVRAFEQKNKSVNKTNALLLSTTLALRWTIYCKIDTERVHVRSC